MKAEFETIPGCHFLPSVLVHCRRCGSEYPNTQTVYGRRLRGPGPHYWLWYCRNDDCYGERGPLGLVKDIYDVVVESA